MILKENEENGAMFLNSTSGYLISSGSAQEKKKHTEVRVFGKYRGAGKFV